MDVYALFLQERDEVFKVTLTFPILVEIVRAVEETNCWHSSELELSNFFWLKFGCVYCNDADR